MMINFCSFEEERLKLVEKAISWFNESDTRVVKFVLGRDTQKIPKSIKIFCQFLSDLLGSLPVGNDDPTIIIPDCSSSSFKHLVDLLTKGYTEACNDMESVVEVAKVLKIDIDNLVADKHSTEDDLEDGEIVDSSDESLSQEPRAQIDETFGRIKVAAFSKSFISVPNLIKNNNEEGSTISNKLFSTNNNSNIELPAISKDSSFQCQVCNRTFSTSSGLKEHMSNTTKHTKVTKNPTKLKPNPTLKQVQVKHAVKPLMSLQVGDVEKGNMVIFKCNLCERQNFKRQCDLNNHKEAIHTRCSSCFSSFKSHKILESHRLECRLSLYNLLLSNL